jgi:hypothetical protein
MAEANRGEAAPPQEKKAVEPILTLPGLEDSRYWDELAEEAERYLRLLAKLKATPRNAPEREDLEDQIIASLNHLVVHGSVLYHEVDEAIENSEEVEEVVG